MLVGLPPPVRRVGHTREGSDSMMVKRASELVIATCKDVDPDAKITSVVRDCGGRTTVRVKSGGGRDASALLNVLKREWPLAQLSVYESMLTGSLEACIQLPTEGDERAIAFSLASGGTAARATKMLTALAMGMALLLYVRDLANGATQE